MGELGDVHIDLLKSVRSGGVKGKYMRLIGEAEEMSLRNQDQRGAKPSSCSLSNPSPTTDLCGRSVSNGHSDRGALTSALSVDLCKT